MNGSQAKHVLLIEDSPEQRAVIQATLEAGGLQVSTADTLASGMTWLATEDVDAVLIDLGLPDAFGLQAAHQIASLNLDAPFLVLTATDDPELSLAAVQIGAEDVMVKGMDEHRIGRAIQFAFKRFQRRAALVARVRQLKLIFKSAPDAVMVLDDNRRVVHANAAAGHMYGVEPALLEGELFEPDVPDGKRVRLRVKRPGGKERRAIALAQGIQDGATHMRLVSIRVEPGD
ncbi:MAG: response regulator [Myxococcales bacterium]|nr:response regulator [Myxococcales bacterium]